MFESALRTLGEVSIACVDDTRLHCSINALLAALLQPRQAAHPVSSASMIHALSVARVARLSRGPSQPAIAKRPG
ncbi:hypothetical protein BJD12_05825 [Xanthomonas vesicatoria ATCC 35937]|uniref:Uncharacterized protein n=1 Tax=Xanthomonas vesicatoria ATCC 35937 TaxID=925775 RepID=F0BGY3_9XANT|nr:hypothetical protein BJD12_05825 [Xanthomonas vesicatoria ATCC 35937]EGD08291.1 hypothetical protein XVE_3511 [Xanthomonas vesicatoria ATCC 35937]KTF34413.1 hypothetical protein LMG920_06385 [Xanthomonas vesicatoria]